MKRPLVLGGLVLAFVATVWVVRVQAEARQRDALTADVDPDTMAAKFHQGERPCLRYPPAADREAPAAYAATAKALDDAGLEVEALASVVGHFLTLHREREAPHHALGSVDEYLAQLESQQTSWFGQLSFSIQRGLLRTKLEKVVDGAGSTLTDHEHEGALAWKKLTDAQRKALEEVEATKPLHLEVSGLVRVVDALRPLTTRRRAFAVAKRLEAAGGATGVLSPHERLDAWGNPFLFEVTDAGVVVRSTGPEPMDPADDVVVTSARD